MLKHAHGHRQSHIMPDTDNQSSYNINILVSLTVCFFVQNSIDTQDRVTLSQLATPSFYRPILISVVMRFLQQMTGITPILVYLEPIFSHSKFALKPRWGL